MNISKKRGGFTLLELLIVVALIGLVASVVLVTLGNAKSKGIDAGVKSNLDTVRGQAELFYNNNLSFLPSGGSTFAIATCPTYNVSGSNMLSQDKTIADAIAQAVQTGGNGSSCYNSGAAWAVAVGLRVNTNTSWCVDSGGNARQVSTVPSGAINGSTFVCN